MSSGWLIILFAASSLFADDGQKGPKPEWPCVPGRAVDPAFLEVSESTGGQIFLFQKSEIARAAPFLNSDSTHPATIVRAIGTLQGKREIEFPVDSTIQSLLVIAFIQCRSAAGLFRPSGTEITAGSANVVDFQSGPAIKVDRPESGKWKVRLEGTGLFVLSVRAQSALRLPLAEFLDSDSADAGEARAAGKTQPRLGRVQWVAAHLAGEASRVALQVLDAANNPKSEPVSAAEAENGYYFRIAPNIARFRLRITGEDASGWPFERVYPVLFNALPRN